MALLISCRSTLLTISNEFSAMANFIAYRGRRESSNRRAQDSRGFHTARRRRRNAHVDLELLFDLDANCREVRHDTLRAFEGGCLESGSDANHLHPHSSGRCDAGSRILNYKAVGWFESQTFGRAQVRLRIRFPLLHHVGGNEDARYWKS